MQNNTYYSVYFSGAPTSVRARVIGNLVQATMNNTSVWAGRESIMCCDVKLIPHWISLCPVRAYSLCGPEVNSVLVTVCCSKPQRPMQRLSCTRAH